MQLAIEVDGTTTAADDSVVQRTAMVLCVTNMNATSTILPEKDLSGLYIGEVAKSNTEQSLVNIDKEI